jgi:ATP-dependent helicase HrpA
MTEDDLILDRPDEGVLAAFPDKMSLRDQRLNVSYRFSPGAEDDGVTLNLPAAMAASIPANRLEWLVPGLFKEKVTALIKGLPKRYRKQLVPATDTAAVVAKEMPRTDDPLATALSRFIHRRFGIDIPAAEWPADTLPDHLKMRVSLKDHRGKEVGAGRDIHRLTSENRGLFEDPSGSAAWRKACDVWETSGLRSWDFGELPEAVEVERDVKAYPALAPEEKSVRIRLYQDPVKAAQVHLHGVERLLSLKMAKELKGLKALCKVPEGVREACAYFGGVTAVQGYVLEAVTRRLFTKAVRSREAFTALQTEIRPKLSAAIQDLGNRVVEVIRAYQETRTFLHTMEKASDNQAALGLCQNIRKQLADLVPIDFPKRYDEDRLGHFPRYLRAMALRAERGMNDPAKDEKKGVELLEFQDALKALQKSLAPESTLEKKAAVADFGWMVEEFKVSLFAQELKTPYPISKKRLRHRVQEIQRMI